MILPLLPPVSRYNGNRPMVRLSQTSIYALHAALLLSQSQRGVPVPCSQLAREGKMPERFLLQILRRLVKHGVLCSTCGVAGGYYLARSARLISLGDVFDAVEKPSAQSAQQFGFVSPSAGERVAESLRAAAKAAHSEFQKLTLASLLSEDGSAKH